MTLRLLSAASLLALASGARGHAGVGDAVGAKEVDDGLRAALGQPVVVALATDGVRVADDLDAKALALRTGERGRHVGEDVEVSAPSGDRYYEIKKIEFV